MRYGILKLVLPRFWERCLQLGTVVMVVAVVDEKKRGPPRGVLAPPPWGGFFSFDILSCYFSYVKRVNDVYMILYGYYVCEASASRGIRRLFLSEEKEQHKSHYTPQPPIPLEAHPQKKIR